MLGDTSKVRLFGNSRIEIDDVFDKKRGIYFVPMLNEGTSSAININKMHGYTGKGAKAAVLDSGVLPEHPYLKNRLEAIEDFTGNGIEDHVGHGTVVTLIMAMTYPDISILSGKVFENDGASLPEQINRIAQGVNWAVDRGAHTISMSLGFAKRKEDLSKETNCSEAVKNVCDAIERAIKNDIKINVAAGANFPADCHKSIIVVGAVDRKKLSENEEHRTLFTNDIAPTISYFFDSYLVPTFVYEGYLSLSNGLYEQALKSLNTAVGKDPQHYQVWYYQGLCFYGLKRYADAIQSFDAAIALDPTDGDVWYRKGMALEALSQSDKAIECFDKVLELEGVTSLPWTNQTESLESESCAEEIRKYYPLNLDFASDAWCNMGCFYEQTNRYDEAAKCYDKAIRLNKKNAKAYNNLGGILGRRGEYDASVKYFDRAIELDPSIVDHWYNKGLALSRLKRYTESLEFLDEAIEKDPSFVMASKERIRVLKKLNEAGLKAKNQSSS